MAEEKYMRMFYSVFDELGLKGNEAIIYTYIKSYTGLGEYFYGSADFLAKKFKISRQTVYRILENLIKSDLLFETKNGLRCTTKMERILMKNRKAHEEYRKKYLREE